MWIFEELSIDHENPKNVVDILIDEAIIDYDKYRALIKGKSILFAEKLWFLWWYYLNFFPKEIFPNVREAQIK